MSFQLKWTEEAAEQYDKIRSAANDAKIKAGKTKKTKSSRQAGLLKQVAKTVQHLRDNPKHPGLETHEYSDLENPYDRKQKVWEAYVQNKTPGAYRVFWCYGPRRDWLTIISTTPHPQSKP